MMKRNKAILCALVGIGFITSAGTVKANAMTMNTNTKTTFKASTVEDWMYRFPYTFNMNIGDQLKAGVGMMYTEYAYSTLGAKQDYVDKGALNNLRQAEKTLKRLFEHERKAYDIVCRISKLADYVGYNEDTKSVSNKNEIKSNKDKIFDEMRSIEKDYNNLDYSVRYTDTLLHFRQVLSDIVCNVSNM